MQQLHLAGQQLRQGLSGGPAGRRAQSMRAAQQGSTRVVEIRSTASHPLSLPLQHVLGGRRVARALLLKAAVGDGASDGEAPVFRAQAPPTSVPAAPPQTASGGGAGTAAASSSSHDAAGVSTSGRGGGGGSTPSSYGSYSDYYKSRNTRYAGQPSSSGQPNPGNSSANITGTPRSIQPSQQSATQPTDPDGSSASSAASGDNGQPPAGPGPNGVESALKRAQAALAAAETKLDSIDQLSSARVPLPAQLQAVLRVARSVVLLGTASVLLVSSHAFGLAWQWAGAVLTAAGIASWGLHRNALSRTGAIAAAAVGCCTLGCSLRMGATLLAFFFTSSKLTQYKEELKADLEEGAKKGGQRDWKQVLCNAGIPTLLAIAYGAMAGCLDLPLGPLPGVETWRSDLLTLLLGGFLGYYACCCGDTWASELGSLSGDTPRLITTLQPVRRGTNGGVTLLGLLASIAGGLFVGAVFYAGALASPTLWVFEPQRAMAAGQWRLIPLGLMAGLMGSVIDSLLGATLQYSGYAAAKGKLVGRPGPGVERISGLPWLSNNAVNLISATITSALTALVALRTFG